MQKKEQKSEAQIASDKAETEALIKRIIEATNTVPAKIRNEAMYQQAVNFKQLAIAARKAAESKSPTLEKLRTAWSTISGYYA